MPTYGTGMLPVPQGHDPQQLDMLAGEMAKLQPELIQQILSQLRGPAPTAPTPPAFTGLSPLAAAAGAMNPQQIPTLINKQLGPEQAQYTQQQQAFEQAMQGRRDALTAGTSLVNSQARADRPYGGRPLKPFQEKNVELNPQTGQYHLVIRYKDPADPTHILAEDDRGPARLGYSYQVDTTTGDIVQMPSAGAPLSGGGGKIINPRKAGSAAETSQTTSAMSLMSLIKDFKSGATEYGSNPQSFGGALTQQTVRGFGDTGVSLSESLGNPKFEVLATKRTKIAKTIAAMREAGKLSDQDVNWAATEIPTIASLATEQGRSSFDAKIAGFENELMARMKRMAEIKPINFTPQELAQLGVRHGLQPSHDLAVDDLLNEYKKARGQ